MSTNNKDYFIENLAMLVDSGMDILSALDSIKAEIRSRSLRKTIDKVKEDIEGGSTFWKALERTRLLGSAPVALIRIGEESGNLSENLSVISIQQEKDMEFRAKIHSAMIYPSIVLSLTFVIGVGISWFLLPRLANIFSDLDVELPAITKFLIGVGTFLNDYGVIAVPGALVFMALMLFFLFIFSKTKFIGQWIAFQFSAIRNIMQEIELARFGYILGTLLEAGLPIIDALTSMSDATSLYMYRKLYRHLSDQVEEGNSFHKSFRSYKHPERLIPQFIQQMINAGENSGKLSEALLKIGRRYESKTEITAKNLTVLLEPILLVIVWLGVLAVALAVILPIYSLIGGFNAA